MPSGGAVTNLSIATSESWKDKTSGEPQERTEWHRVVFFNRLAEIAGEYVKKGIQAYMWKDHLRTRKWQGQDGQDRYTRLKLSPVKCKCLIVEVVQAVVKEDTVHHKAPQGRVSAASEPRATPRAPQQQAPQQQAPQQQSGPFDDDIPF